MAFEYLTRLLRPSVEREVDDEIEFHLEMRTRELVARGLDPQAARADAERLFHDLGATKRACRKIAHARERDAKRRVWRGELRQDLAFALGQMARKPGFTAVAVLTLALGIGATTAIFSVFHAVVLQPLPFPQGDRICLVASTWRDSPGGMSAGNFLYVRERQRSFVPLAAVEYRRLNLAERDTPERIAGAAVSHDYFAVFGIAPFLGRTFTAEEDAPGSDQVAVLGHRLWVRAFGSDPAVVGRRIVFSGVSREVIGVMPPELETVDGREVWIPIAFTPERRTMHDEHYLTVYGRLRPQLGLAQARAELAGVAGDLVRDHPRENQERGLRALPLLAIVVGDSGRRIGVLLAAVSVVLLMACANVANLLLGRGAARERELAVRAALGAGRARFVRQLLTESALLGLAEGGRRLLLATAPPGIARLESARTDLSVLAFALGTGLVASLLFGLAPALQSSRMDLRASLGEGARGATSGIRPDRIRRVLVAAEVGLALTILVGAGLLVRTGINLTRARLGFEPDGVVSARLGLPREGYTTHEKTVRAFEGVLEGLRVRPEIDSAALVSKLPLTRGAGSNGLIPENRVLDPKSSIDTDLQVVSVGYFETMRIPVRSGRYLTVDDRRGTPKVMIINETLARLAFPGESAVGKRIACCEPGEGGPDTPSWKTVVGVVADVSPSSPGAPGNPQFYLPMDQVPEEAWDWISRTLGLVVRSAQASSTVVPLVRQAVRAVDPSVPVYDVQTMIERRDRSMAQERFGATLLSALGAVGLLLAAVGIYGVVAFSVGLRTREIAVRLALGATPRDVTRLVLREGLGPVLAGLALGLIGAVAAGRALGSVLFGVGAVDPPTLTAMAVLLLLVAVLASVVPARRAVRVDPSRALADV